MMQRNQNKIHFFHRAASCLLLLQMLHSANATDADENRESSSQILHLQGPRNTSVETGATVQLRCRLLTMKTPYLKTGFQTSTLASPSVRFVPWRASGNQIVSVQWNIDGFGFTNDSLMETYGGRYIMPGPLNEGLFDLYVYKVQKSDQTSFSCQVTIQTFQLLQPPRVKTLTSSTVFITIYSAPNRLLLKQIPIPLTSKLIQDGSIKLPLDRLQSDNPSHIDVHTFQNFDDAESTLPRPPTARKYQHFASFGETTLNNDDEIWALEGYEISLECLASPSHPVSRLMWILSPVAEIEADLSLPPAFDFEGFAEKSRLLKYDREYPKWRYVFNSREGTGLGFKVESKETADSVSGLLVGSSTLTLRMSRSLSGRRLECLVQNAAAFEKSVMPKVATTLQVLYINNMSITKNVSNDQMLDGSFRENETVRFRCTVDSNPNELRYLWTLKDPSLAIPSKVIPERGEITEVEEDKHSHNGFFRLQLGPRERKISTSAFVDLQITSQLHGQLLRCWASPVTAKSAESSGSIDSPTWKHTSLLISVNYGPKLQGPEEEVEAVTMRETAHLTCQVEANPPAIVTWYHYRGIKVVSRATQSAYPNATGLYTPTVVTHRLLRSFLQADLESRDFKKLRSEERYSALNVKTHSVDNFGIYICVGLAAQREVKKIIVLAESGPPTIETPKRVSARVGEHGRIVCNVIALPKPSPHDFLWSSSSARAGIIPSSSLHIEHEEKITGSISALVFPKITKEHFGNYNCTVITSFGSASAIIAFIEIEETPYTLAIAFGVASVLAAIFAGIFLWIIRRHILHKRSGKTAQIITANHNSRSSIELRSDQISTIGQYSMRDGFLVENFNMRPEVTSIAQTYHMQSYSSLLHSPVHVISYEDGTPCKCMANTNPNTPLLSRLHGASTNSSPTLRDTKRMEVITGSPKANNGVSRLALLTNYAGATDGFQDHAFPV